MPEKFASRLGRIITEATIGQWYKKVGDSFSVDEPLLELETDKVTPGACARCWYVKRDNRMKAIRLKLTRFWA